jgi:hypothetical protein
MSSNLLPPKANADVVTWCRDNKARLHLRKIVITEDSFRVLWRKKINSVGGAWSNIRSKLNIVLATSRRTCTDGSYTYFLAPAYHQAILKSPMKAATQTA